MLRHRADGSCLGALQYPVPVSRGEVNDAFCFFLAEPAADLRMTEVPSGEEEASIGRTKGAVMAASGDLAAPCCQISVYTFMASNGTEWRYNWQSAA